MTPHVSAVRGQDDPEVELTIEEAGQESGVVPSRLSGECSRGRLRFSRNGTNRDTPHHLRIRRADLWWWAIYQGPSDRTFQRGRTRGYIVPCVTEGCTRWGLCMPPLFPNGVCTKCLKQDRDAAKPLPAPATPTPYDPKTDWDRSGLAVVHSKGWQSGRTDGLRVTVHYFVGGAVPALCGHSTRGAIERWVESGVAADGSQFCKSCLKLETKLREPVKEEEPEAVNLQERQRETIREAVAAVTDGLRQEATGKPPESTVIPIYPAGAFARQAADALNGLAEAVDRLSRQPVPSRPDPQAERRLAEVRRYVAGLEETVAELKRELTEARAQAAAALEGLNKLVSLPAHLVELEKRLLELERFKRGFE